MLIGSHRKQKSNENKKYEKQIVSPDPNGVKLTHKRAWENKINKRELVDVKVIREAIQQAKLEVSTAQGWAVSAYNDIHPSSGGHIKSVPPHMFTSAL
ncbi:hypothetical protein PoB_004207300 [Plakobranchus ocellatus]|uniref:Uncharacterized protein n=1 Tax=Plakobranchus ocellatus TaxID=259542 RepID=A0AAV4B9T5_9GAST|nr:hypothetical protein PoB_004207300 [Plakobranchus ocellatus]